MGSDLLMLPMLTAQELAELEWTDPHRWLHALLSRLPKPTFSESVKLGESLIEGMGLLAARDIRVGEILVVETGPRVGTDVVEQLAEFGFDCVTRVAWGESAYIVSAPVNEGEGGWINHSCTPNAGMIADGIWAAIRSIEAGEEVTCDYGTFETARGWEMECRCGSSSCRGMITYTDWKDASLQLRLGQWFAPFLKHHIKETTGRALDEEPRQAMPRDTA